MTVLYFSADLCPFLFCSVKNVKALLPEELALPLFLGSISGYLSHDYITKMTAIDNRHIMSECETNKNLLEVELALAGTGMTPSSLLNLPKGTVLQPLANVLQVTRCAPVRGNTITSKLMTT